MHSINEDLIRSVIRRHRLAERWRQLDDGTLMHPSQYAFFEGILIDAGEPLSRIDECARANVQAAEAAVSLGLEPNDEGFRFIREFITEALAR